MKLTKARTQQFIDFNCPAHLTIYLVTHIFFYLKGKQLIFSNFISKIKNALKKQVHQYHFHYVQNCHLQRNR